MLILYNIEDGESRTYPGAVEHRATVKHFLTVAIARVAERVRQGGHHIPEDVIRRRFAAGLRNFESAYKPAVDAWANNDNEGESPVLLEWGENP